MARKKKQTEEKQENIKAEVREDTRASGNVKITLLKNGKQIGKIVTHNTGTIYLCEYMVSALIGDYVIAQRPGIVVPFSGATEDVIKYIGNGTPYASAKLGANVNYWKNHDSNYNENDPSSTFEDGGFCTATLTFLIPSAITSGSIIDGFRLFSKDESRKLYATVWLPAPLEVQGDTNIKIEWTLYVSYKWDIDRTL